MSESRRRSRRGPASASAVDAVILALAALAAFWPALRNGFVNWDDPTVLVDNAHLGEAGAASWAFSTTLIGHYQPLAWLVWSAMRRQFGLWSGPYHALSIAIHVVNGILVYAMVRRLARDSSLEPVQQRAGALLAGLIFLLHPTSVETVAWASAFPYVLSLCALLLSFMAYISGRMRVSIALYAASLFTRAAALGYPLILLIADWYPLHRQRRAGPGRRIADKVPFFALAAGAAVAEWYARDVANLQEIGLGARATLAATAPFVYLWRSVWPVRLSPLNPLPIAPTLALVPLAIAVAGAIAVSALSWRLRTRWPLIGAAWVIYLILLAPIAGLTPTGVQATADRYMYVPNVVVASVVGIVVAPLLTTGPAGSAVAVAATVAVAALGSLTWHQSRYWKSSIALWTRAADLDPRNDIATYNLAIALAEDHRDDEAIGWYERTLALVPDHDLARRNLAILQAAGAERNADRLAAAGRADEASVEYARALALDAGRLHSRAARGMLFMSEGRLDEAIVELRLAADGGVKDAAVPNALAFALAQTGEPAQAARVLGRAVDEHPDDVNLKHNLARLLATAPDSRVRDGPRALRLASEVCERTGNRDPRALDTLSAAYAAVGRFDMARATASRAAARARELGDVGTADEIIAHARGYRP